MENTLLQIAVAVLGAGAVYGGIRADLRHMTKNIDRHEDAIVELFRIVERRNYVRSSKDAK